MLESKMKKIKTIFFNQKAFSLIEVMVTLVISTIISGVTAYTFLELHSKSNKLIKKTDDSVSLSLFRKFANKDLSRIGKFSVGAIDSKTHFPATGGLNFFDYYQSYPVHFLDKQTRKLTFDNTDAANTNSYIYFLEPYTGVNGVYNVDPFKLYDYSASDELFSEPGTDATIDPAKLKEQVPNDTIKINNVDTTIRKNMFENKNLILFYTPLYLGPNPLKSDKPVRLYSYLGVSNNNGASVTLNEYHNLLIPRSPVPGYATFEIKTLDHVIRYAPLVGGNKFQLYMTRVQWITYFFKKSASATEGGKLYRCVHAKQIDNFLTICTASTGTLILDNIKTISFSRRVDSGNIKVSVKLVKN